MNILSPYLRNLLSSEFNSLEFWDEISNIGTPLVEKTEEGKKLLTFLYRERTPIENVVVVLGPAGLDFCRNKMTKIDGTDIWYRTYILNDDFKFQYLLSPNDPLTYPIDLLPDYQRWAEREANFIIDPLNKYPFPISNPMVSTVSSTKNVSDYESELSYGKVEEFTIRSENMNNERLLRIYTPLDINDRESVSLFVMLDGELHPELVPVIHIVDQLIGSNLIRPIMVALVGNSSEREKEMGCNELFSRFLAKELPSFIKQRKNIEIGNDNCICGFSIAGVCALFTSTHHHRVYRKNIFASAALYWSPQGYNEPEFLISLISEVEKKDIQIYFEVGKMEDHAEYQRYAGGTSNLLSNRHLRHVLKAKGYDFQYFEFNGGHDFINWSDTVKRGLIHF